jgi:hypothetical protein
MPNSRARKWLASQAETTSTRNGTTDYNPDMRGLFIHVNTASETGTAVYTPGVQILSPDGTYNTVWTAAAGISANTDSTYLLYPGALNGNYTEVDGISVGGHYRVVLTATTADGSNNMTTLVDGWELI